MILHSTREQQLRMKVLVSEAVSLAMGGQWAQAIEANRAILNAFPDDLGSYNRLGKALSELGQISKAREAFRRVLEISPQNAIAQKNLQRLSSLSDEAPAADATSAEAASAARRAFIGESGRAGVTTLTNAGAPQTLLKLAPGKPLKLVPAGKGLRVTDPCGDYVGSVAPKLGARLLRLINGGNVYEAAVTSIDGNEVTIIVREVFKHPSQAETVSFPNLLSSDRRHQVPSTHVGYEVVERRDTVSFKDWSDDDTEPGDDDAFRPVVHGIINASGDDPEERLAQDY
jgi:hypothetical protein